MAERNLLAVQVRILSLLCRSQFSADHRGHMRIEVEPEALEAERRRLVGMMHADEQRKYELFLESGRHIRQERQLLIKLLIKELQYRSLLSLMKMERGVYEREPASIVSAVVRSCVGANDAERWNELLSHANRVHVQTLHLAEISIGAVEDRMGAALAAREEAVRFELGVWEHREARVATGDAQDRELMALAPSGVDFGVHLAAEPEWSWRALWGDTLDLCGRLKTQSAKLYSDLIHTFSELGFLEAKAGRKPFDAEAAREKDAVARAALIAALEAKKEVEKFSEALRRVNVGAMSQAEAHRLVERADLVFRIAVEALEKDITYKKRAGGKAGTETMDAAFALLGKAKQIASSVERNRMEEELLIRTRKLAETDELNREASRLIRAAQAARTAHEAEDGWKRALQAARRARAASEIEPVRAGVAQRHLQEAERGLQAAFQRIDREAAEEERAREAAIRETLEARAREAAERMAQARAQAEAMARNQRMAQARAQAEAMARAQAEARDRERERDRDRERERDRDRERESDLERERRETERARQRREAERQSERVEVRPGATRIAELNPSYFKKFVDALPSDLRAEVKSDPNADAEKTIKRARKLSSIKLHPDKGGDPEQFKEMNSAFENLKRIHNWSGVLRRKSKRKSKKRSSKKRSVRR